MTAYPYRECANPDCRHDDVNHDSRYSHEDGLAPCLMSECRCKDFIDKPKPEEKFVVSPVAPSGMTNAQAALISAAASMPPSSSAYEIRLRAAEFSLYLDNVDAQGQFGARKNERS